eukprot:2693735-Prorocentrum_lima.AAC.1
MGESLLRRETAAQWLAGAFAAEAIGDSQEPHGPAMAADNSDAGTARRRKRRLDADGVSSLAARQGGGPRMELQRSASMGNSDDDEVVVLECGAAQSCE